MLRPILAQSGWFALFNSTPNWKNHFYDLANMAEKNDNWFYQKLTVEDTGVVSPEYIQEERETWMTEEMIQQEYYCSFDIWAIWSYYADLMAKASEQGRICKLPKNFSPVDIYFDLGRNDSTSLWFKQNDDQFYNFIHYFEDAGKHISYYFNYIKEYLKKYNLMLGSVFFPHDSSQVRIDTEKTSLQQAQEEFWSHNVVYLNRTNSTQKDIDKVILVGPEVTTRGFIYVKDSTEMIQEIKKISEAIIEKNINDVYIEYNKIKNEIREELGRYLYQETECKPMIIAVVQEL